MSDQDSLKTALVENLDREDLNPIEEAKGYQRLIVEFQFTHQEIAEIFGKNRSTVSNILRLLQLPEEIQKAISRGELAEGHTRPLLSLPDEAAMLELYEQIKRDSMTVRQIEENIASKNPNGSKKKSKHSQLSLFTEFENQLSEKLNTATKIQGTRTSGKIVIRYSSEGQFEALVSALQRVS